MLDVSAPGGGLRELTESMDARSILAAWRAAGEAAFRVPPNLYAHVPFCRQRCAYCCYYSVAVRKPDALDAYVDSLRREMRFFAEAFRGRVFGSSYVGGGTPSLLDAAQIRLLLSEMCAHYRVDAEGARTFECDPDGVTREKLLLLREFGINRLGMGVQSTSRRVLTLENRGYQRLAVVARAAALARKVGGFALILDLLLGLRGDDEASFLRSFARVMEMEPDAIRVYLVWPQPAYLAAFYRGDAGLFRMDLSRRFSGLIPALRRLARGRYHWRDPRPALSDNSWTFARVRRLSTRRRFYYDRAYTDFSAEPMSLLGLGPSARSRVAGALSYINAAPAHAEFSEDRPFYRARRLSEREEMAKYMALRVAEGGEISRRDFQRFFATTPEREFARGIADLRREGLLSATAEGYAFAPRSDRRRSECAARLSAMSDGARGAPAPAPGREPAGAAPKRSGGSSRGRWRLRVELAREGVAYSARAGSWGLRLREESAAPGSPRRPHPLLVWTAARALERASRVAQALAPRALEARVLCVLSRLAVRLRADVLAESGGEEGDGTLHHEAV